MPWRGAGSPVPRPRGVEVGWSFRHRTLRERLVARAHTAGRLGALSAAAAAVLAGRADPLTAERRARHLADTPQHVEACDALHAAAVWRTRLGDPQTAEELLAPAEAALARAGEGPTLRVGRSRSLALTLSIMRGGGQAVAAQAEALAIDAERHGWPTIRAEALFLRAAVGRMAGEAGLEQALGAVRRAGSRSGTAEALLALATLQA